MFFQNRVNIEGRLCQTPEIKTSKNGVKYCRFSVCYNQNKRSSDEDGKYEWESIPHFFNVVCYKKVAEQIAKYKKGEPVSIHGQLQYSQYTDKNGERSTSISISAESVKKIFIEKRDKTKDPTPEPNTYPREPVTYSNDGDEIYSDDIPF